MPLHPWTAAVISAHPWTGESLPDHYRHDRLATRPVRRRHLRHRVFVLARFRGLTFTGSPWRTKLSPPSGSLRAKPARDGRDASLRISCSYSVLSPFELVRFSVKQEPPTEKGRYPRQLPQMEPRPTRRPAFLDITILRWREVGHYTHIASGCWRDCRLAWSHGSPSLDLELLLVDMRKQWRSDDEWRRRERARYGIPFGEDRPCHRIDAGEPVVPPHARFSVPYRPTSGFDGLRAGLAKEYRERAYPVHHLDDTALNVDPDHSREG